MVTEEKVGVVASVSGATTDATLLPVNLEMLLLPLAYQTRSDARVLGALAPMAAPYWLGAKAIGPLTLGMFRHVGDPVDAVAGAPVQGRGRPAPARSDRLRRRPDRIGHFPSYRRAASANAPLTMHE